MTGGTMRALIRADLFPEDHFVALWAIREDWDAAVRDVFFAMGYAALAKGQVALEEDVHVQSVLSDIPDDILTQEQKHLVMLGYISDGQSHFVVTGINPTELHIRIKGQLLGRLRRACVDMYLKSLKLEAPGIRRMLSDPPARPLLRFERVIEVFEPKRDNATIAGTTIRSAREEVMRDNKNEVRLAIFTFLGTVLLFVATPSLAPIMQPWVAWLGPGFTVQYVQGFLERVASAFVVTLAYSIINLIVKMLDVRRTKPIRWDPDIEVTPNVR
jgi:hypothetical protein